MATNKIIYVLAFTVLLCTVNLFAQNKDMQLWTNVSLEKKVTKTISLNFSEEARFNENITEVGQFFSDIGCTYKISKAWRLSINYRFTNKKQLADSYSKRHRYYVDLSYKKKLEKIVFQLRTRFQSQYTDVYCSNTGKIPEYYSRNKITTKVDLDKKYIPYLSAEMYYQLNNPEGNKIDNMRYAGGIEYQFNKKASIDLFYMFQREYNVKSPQKDFVIGIGYCLSL